MTSHDTLYKVKTDNGLGGTVFGRDAADALAAELIARPDVVSVEVAPVKPPCAECNGTGRGHTRGAAPPVGFCPKCGPGSESA